jgi:hypothetical protein
VEQVETRNLQCMSRTAVVFGASSDYTNLGVNTMTHMHILALITAFNPLVWQRKQQYLRRSAGLRQRHGVLAYDWS